MEDGLTIRIPARFASAGQFLAQPGWTHPKRVLDTTVLIVVEGGRFGLSVDGRAHILEGNQALLLPAGLAHGGFHCDNEAPARYYWAHFEQGQGAGGQALQLGLGPVELADIAFSRIANGFHQLLNENISLKLSFWEVFEVSMFETQNHFSSYAWLHKTKIRV